MRRLIVAVLFLPLFGCVSGLRMQSLPASHPASPEAEEALIPRGSPTLALPEAGSGNDDARAVGSKPGRKSQGGGHVGH